MRVHEANAVSQIQMEGHASDDITFTQNVKKAGYETVVPLKTTNALYLAANALAADGTILGTSDVWDMALGKSVSDTLEPPPPPGPNATHNPTATPLYPPT